MTNNWWVLESRKKGSKNKFTKAGPYVFPRKSDFGSITKLKRSFPELELRFKKAKRPKKVVKSRLKKRKKKRTRKRKK